MLNSVGVRLLFISERHLLTCTIHLRFASERRYCLHGAAHVVCPRAALRLQGVIHIARLRRAADKVHNCKKGDDFFAPSGAMLAMHIHFYPRAALRLQGVIHIARLRRAAEAVHN